MPVVNTNTSTGEENASSVNVEDFDIDVRAP